MGYVSLDTQILYNPPVASLRAAVAEIMEPEVTVLLNDDEFDSDSDYC